MPTDRSVITSGFREDCQALVDRFEQGDSIRFESFCEVWKNMKFSLIFTGRRSYVELLEFCEEALNICKQFLFLSPRFKERIAGLYLVYGVYYKMPVNEFKIKVKLQEWQTLMDLHSEIKTGEHMDANYILCKLIADNAFHFSLFDREMLLEKHLRQNDKQQVNPYSLLPSIKHLADKNEILSRLNELSQLYTEKKNILSAISQPSSSLKLYKDNIAEDMIREIHTFEDQRKNSQLSNTKNVQKESLPSTSRTENKNRGRPQFFRRRMQCGEFEASDVESENDTPDEGLDDPGLPMTFD